MNRLEGKTALITGASGSFGRDIALLFAAEGADLALTGNRNMANLDRLKQEIEDLGSGRKVTLIQCDLSKEEGVKRAVGAANTELGGVDILINNAGFSQTCDIQDLSLADWQTMLDTNLTGAFLCCREVIEQMIGRGSGKIVNISSISAVTGRRVAVNYAATKAGMLGLTRTLAAQVAPHGVNVNAIAPGPIRTAVHDGFPEEAIKKLFSSIIYNRLGEPRDVANLVLFLSCDEGSWITGEVIQINGGAFIG